MANFNKTTNNTTTSYEGGKVYEKNPKDELTNMLFSSFLEDNYYEDAAIQEKRYLDLLDGVSPEFAAKLSVFARNEIGQRSMAQLTAAYLADKTFANKRKYYKNFCHRPDDVAEIFAATDHLNKKRNNSMVRGFKDYLETLSPYQLDKYKMKNRDYNLFDCISICHPKSRAINQLEKSTLPKAETWEQRISAAKTPEEKAKQWVELINSHSLGYIALIRNLSNILEALSVDDFNQVYKELQLQLTDEIKIQKSMVLPYQIYSAYSNLRVRNLDVCQWLSTAFKISVQNMPQLSGKTAVILDVSGSMDTPISFRSNITIKEAGAVYAASIILSNPDSIVVKFGSKAKIFAPNLNNNIFSIIADMCDNENLGYGTDVASAFQTLGEYHKVNRIFLISDMQVMEPLNYYGYETKSPINSYKDYISKFGATKIYSFDLGHYHSTIANQNYKDVVELTALNDTVFKFIKLAENNESIADYIENNYNYF